ncbi:MAG: UDP-glucose 4-epimerase GalE [Litorimonas sp.]
MQTSKSILVLGGAGYIGTHTCVDLIESGYEVVVFDNFSNSSEVACERVRELTGKSFPVIRGDIADQVHVEAALKEYSCESVIHFAGLKAVGESSENPLSYYEANVSGTLTVLKAMKAQNVKNIVFSSSATVYGEPEFLPLTEEHPLSAMNPYGQTKLMVEHILRDLHKSDPEWSISILRYFNPCGSHESGLIGESPTGVPNNLVPFIAQVASGRREALNVWGNDYDTPDGTGIRDYIHVVDLAAGHVSALQYLEKNSGVMTVNLGTGRGYSVLEVLAEFSRASGKALPHIVKPRREGDLASYFADPSLAKSLLDWSASRTLQDMCADHWNWQSQNPYGYEQA